jgi:hypothetical protein
MKKALLLAMLLLVVPLFASAQHVHQSVKGKVIDGRANPELIPDSEAYRLYLRVLTVPANPTAAQVDRQSAHLSKLGLDAIDQIQLIGILRNYRGGYDNLVARFNAEATAAQARGEVVTDTLLRQQLDDLVAGTRAQLKSLSDVAVSNIDTVVQREKSRIKIFKSEAQ